MPRRGSSPQATRPRRTRSTLPIPTSAGPLFQSPSAPRGSKRSPSPSKGSSLKAHRRFPSDVSEANCPGRTHLPGTSACNGVYNKTDTSYIHANGGYSIRCNDARHASMHLPWSCTVWRVQKARKIRKARKTRKVRKVQMARKVWRTLKCFSLRD